MFAERPTVSRPHSASLGFTPARQGPAPPESAPAVAAALLGYLKRRPRLRGLTYSDEPSPVTDGWETYLYHFRVRGEGLPPSWDRPLTLRIHASAMGLQRAWREFEIPRYVASCGYPVPQPVLWEEKCHIFGAPFLIMERVPGQTLLQLMLQHPLRPLRFARQMAALHAGLHALPAAEMPAPRAPFLDRELGELRRAIARFGLDGLVPGLDWLWGNRPAAAASPCVLHLDFHPLNLIAGPDGKLTVLDWTYADRGDPHADVAATLALLECVPVPDANLWDRVIAGVGRPLIARQYLRSYRRRRPLDWGRLSYYRAWAALRLLVRYGRWLRSTPAVNDCKPVAVDHLSPDLLRSLCSYFRYWAGVEVSP